MIKLTAVIIGRDCSLIGFAAQGNPEDFGMMGKDKMNVNLSLNDLLQRKFVNNQIDCSKGTIKEIGGFRVCNLPAAFLKDNGELEPCSNLIDITARFMHNNEPIGYRVKIGHSGVECDLNIKNIITVANWMRPNNFIIKHSSSKKMFISGKHGIMRLEELPVIEVGETTSKAKRPKSSAQDTDGSDVKLSSDFDILDLYEMVASKDGFIIRLAEDRYNKTTTDNKKVSNEFISSGLPEVASGYGSFNPKKLSVNLGFKKIGMVFVEFSGGDVRPVYTYTYVTKSLISAGQKHIKSIVIGVSEEHKQKIITELCKTMGIKEVNVPEVINPVKSITGMKDIQLIAIDTSKLELIAKSKVDGMILSCEQLAQLISKAYKLKAMNKYLKMMTPIWEGERMIAEQDLTGDLDRTRLFPAFRQFDYESLNSIILAGIDIFDGSYKKTQAVTSEDIKTETKEKAEQEKEESASIVYRMTGYDVDKISGKEIATILDGTADKTKLKSFFDYDMINQLNSVADITNIDSRVEEAKALQKKLFAEISQYDKMLWQHECAMLTVGNGATIHNHDKERWEVDAKYRGKKGIRYICKVSGLEGMTVEVTGVTISK